MKLAIIVPYRDRSRYLNVLLQLFPEYLEKNNIKDYKIFVSEQSDKYMFNIGISRNVAAMLAQSQDKYDYFLFNDVDIVPVSGVDLSYSEECIVWLMNGGGCKVPVETYNKVYGYNIAYNGWGCEEIDFWYRVCKLHKNTVTWINTEECKKAKMINLDMNIRNTEESIRKSKEYFGVDGPTYIPFPLKPISKHSFYSPVIHSRNKKILDFVHSLSKEQLESYVKIYGSNQINLQKVEVKYNSEKLCHLEYDKVEVLVQN